MIYLASPYFHPVKFIRELRHKEALKLTARLINEGLFVYSPIVHCHEMSKKYSLPGSFEFWKSYNFDMLEKADNFFIFTHDGWDKSVGVKGETERACELRIPCFFIDRFAKVTPCG